MLKKQKRGIKLKKITSIILVIALVFLLESCKDENNGEVKSVEFSVIAPVGSPALAQTFMESTLPSLGDNVTYDIEIVSGVDPLIVAFGSESHEIIYAPTNLGAKLISTGVPYKFAGTVVWGNLYLATGTDEEFTMADLDGKDIVVFGQNATPDIILQTILDAYTWVVEPTITYVADAGTAMGEVVLDPSKIVLLAEPVLSVASLPSKVGNMKSIDLQAEWAKITGDNSYPQAGIFVHEDLDKDVVEAYLLAVQNSINEALTNTAAVAQMAVDLEYGTFPLPVLLGAIPRSNLEFMSALDSRTDLETYFGYIIAINPALIGGALPEDSFYFE